jgi:hypothetical protein
MDSRKVIDSLYSSQDAELHRAFDLVKPKADWKGPINALIDASERAAVDECG